MVSAGSDVCNLRFRDNYCSKTTAAKLFAGNQEKDKCSLWDVSVVPGSLSSVFDHYIIFMCDVDMMYVHVCSCELCCIVAVSGL